jgi:hypothetical protein
MEPRQRKSSKSLDLLRTRAPFPSLLGKIWIEKDQIQRKEEKEALE